MTARPRHPDRDIPTRDITTGLEQPNSSRGPPVLLPSVIAAPLQEKAGVDRLNALYAAIDFVRRSGTVSLSGV